MNVEEFLARRERNRLLEIERAKQPSTEPDLYDDDTGWILDCVGVRQTLGGGRFRKAGLASRQPGQTSAPAAAIDPVPFGTNIDMNDAVAVAADPADTGGGLRDLHDTAV